MACDQTKWTIVEGGLDQPDVRELLAHHFTEMRDDSPPDACHVLPLDALRHPSIRVFTLRDRDAKLLGIGALKAIGPGHGEIKSMRTSPSATGLGVGGAMLSHLVSVGRGMRMNRLSLETGNSTLFEAANRLYQRDGFERCGPFGDYADTPFTYFYTRRI